MTSPKKITHVLKSVAVGTLVIFCFGAAGEICGGFFETTVATFGTSFPDNDPDDIKKVLSVVNKGRITRGSTVETPIALFVVQGTPQAIVAWDMQNNRQLWKIAQPVHSSLSVNEESVVFLSGTSVVAHALTNGKRLWEYEIDEGWNYYGVDVEDDLAVISIGIGGEYPGSYSNGALIGIDTDNGSELIRVMSGGGLLGRPALCRGLAFIPWDRQKIVVIDIARGQEVCRIRADDFTIDFVQNGPDGIYYGSSSTSEKTVGALYRFDINSAHGTREGATAYVPALEPVPGDPDFVLNAFKKPIAGDKAGEKIRFHLRPAGQGEAISLLQNAFYLHYWRYIVAFNASNSHVRWIYRADQDIQSIAVLQDGVAAVDERGNLLVLDAKNGKPVWNKGTKQRVLFATFAADDFRIKSPTTAAPDPLEHLKAMIWDKDNRMLPIRAYATVLMAMIPKPEVTRDLLQIYSDAAIPKGLRDAIIKALEHRSTGAEYLVKALDVHYDFLEGTRAPPMHVVSAALANMKEKSAVPGLIDHLLDHETPVEHIKPIALAIRDLGGPEAAKPLQKYLTLYRSDSSFVGNEDGLAAVADALVQLMGKEGERLINRVRSDRQTLPELKMQLAVLMADSDESARAELELAETKRKEAETRAQQKAKERAHAKERAAAGPPMSLQRSDINKVIAKNREAIKPCVQLALSKMPTLSNIRLRLVIEGPKGKATQVQVLPNNIQGLKACLENSFEKIRFPVFRNPRQMATYSINIRGTKALTPEELKN